MITSSSFNYLLSILNEKRTAVEKSEISKTFSGLIKQSDINTLRDGTIEILEDYGFTGLQDALSCAGYDYPTWKNWNQNYIGERSYIEILRILVLMFTRTIHLISDQHDQAWGLYTFLKGWWEDTIIGYSRVIGSPYSISAGEDLLIPKKYSTRANGYFDTSVLSGATGISRAKMILAMSKSSNADAFPDYLEVCQSGYYSRTLLSALEGWELVGEVIDTIPPPITAFNDGFDIREIEIPTSLINTTNITPMAVRIINDTLGGDDRGVLIWGDINLSIWGHYSF